MKKIKTLASSFLLVIFILDTKISLAADSYTLPGNTGLPDNQGGIVAVLVNLLNWLLLVFGIIAVISFIISGLQYFLAAGDEKQMQSAKRTATYSILGVIVALSAFVIIRAIDAALRAGSTNF